MTYNSELDAVLAILGAMDDRSVFDRSAMNPYDFNEMVEELCGIVEDYQSDVGTYDTGHYDGYASGFNDGKEEGYEDAAADVLAALDNSY